MRYAWLILLLSSPLILSAQNYRKHAFEQGGFVMDVPVAWQVKDTFSVDGNEALVAEISYLNESEFTYFNSRFIAGSMNTGVTEDVFMANTANTIRKNWGFTNWAETKKEKKTSASGQPYWILDGIGSDAEGAFYALRIRMFFRGSDYMAMISQMSQMDMYRYDSELTQMTESFRWKTYFIHLDKLRLSFRLPDEWDGNIDSLGRQIQMAPVQDIERNQIEGYIQIDTYPMAEIGAGFQDYINGMKTELEGSAYKAVISRSEQHATLGPVFYFQCTFKEGSVNQVWKAYSVLQFNTVYRFSLICSELKVSQFHPLFESWLKSINFK